MRVFLFLFSFSFGILVKDVLAVKSSEKTEEVIKYYDDKEFQKWIVDFKKMAFEDYDISKGVLDNAFKNVKYNPKVIKSDRKQPEFMRTFWSYSDRALNADRIANGKIMMKKYKTLLKNVSEKYGVSKEIIVAFWGLETNYGKILGKYNLIQSLTTLSFDNRRSEFFTKELINVLKIIDAGHMKQYQLVGSWAGAFGNFQFMPSTFMAYAVDGNGDGRINLTSDIVDAMHSAGNYLSKMGWDDKYRWGRPVLVEADDLEVWKYVNSNQEKPLHFFRSLGVKKFDGKLVDNVDIDSKLVAPNGINGPVFVVYDNFKYIMRWNASVNYALSIGLLADVLVSNTLPMFERPDGWDKIKTLSTNQIKEIQEKLTDLDMFSSKFSGIYGRKTMIAIKEFQTALIEGDKRVSRKKKPILNYKSGNPVVTDGYPSVDLYEILLDI